MLRVNFILLTFVTMLLLRTTMTRGFDEEKWNSDWPDWETKLNEWKQNGVQVHLTGSSCKGKPDETFFWSGCLACTCLNEEERCQKASECKTD